uniref:Uncharacterized protein n=1 Tax=Trichobilharzia regenti TaxID=157069 RepID=A0AA85JG20_TRIRE|nr:unnamed protein product [Trichobilharzia regenti]
MEIECKHCSEKRSLDKYNIHIGLVNHDKKVNLDNLCSCHEERKAGIRCLTGSPLTFGINLEFSWNKLVEHISIERIQSKLMERHTRTSVRRWNLLEINRNTMSHATNFPLSSMHISS